MKIMSFWLAKAHQQKSDADVTHGLNDVFPRGACRKTESAGNGVLSSGEKNFSVHKTYMNFLRPRKRASEAALYDLRGRSMVEMLGVMAIIGVLSVGAISGYQKAMFKYRLNKQSEQYNQLINGGLRFAGQWNFSSTTELVPYFKKMNIVPKEMIEISNNNILKDVFGNSVYVKYIPSAKWTSFFINYQINNDSSSVEICRNTFIIAKAYHAQLFSISSISNFGTEQEAGKYYGGDDFCGPGSRKCIKDLSLAEIDDMCRVHINQDGSHLKITWMG